ncbi:MAG TPA: four helix bundle protein [Kiritimatiellia bacterium]|nr:four helix bundle protein [Kiritimatiellia bacterium]HRZ11792.1 four helix bundle protein [Kiritimatiellia bacterium]HSA17402.1 four helix bundle protein [Kiritimatiellia bacterium]
MRDHTKLRAFELADQVVMLTYQITRHFPKAEAYGLTAQMRRAAVSIASNIVEGCARGSQPDYLRFLEIAFGSLRELHYQLTVARRLGYCDEAGFIEGDTIMLEAEKVLGALIRALRRN